MENRILKKGKKNIYKRKNIMQEKINSEKKEEKEKRNYIKIL